MLELLIGLIPIGAILLVTLIICLICAIFEIKHNTADTAERLDEICKKLDDMPKNNSVLTIRDELVDIAEHIKKE